jgi:hypothetical protein
VNKASTKESDTLNLHLCSDLWPRERGVEGNDYGGFQTSLTLGVNITRTGVLLNT